MYTRSRDSSVSIVSVLQFEVGVRLKMGWGENDFLFPTAPLGSRVHVAYHPEGTAGSFSEPNQSHPSNVGNKKPWSYTSITPHV
jgi:hypothetical protein